MKKTTQKRFLGLWIDGGLTLFVYFMALEINFLGLYGNSPGFKELKDPPLATSSELYTVDSVLIGKYFEENRTPIRYEELSPVLVQALLATEDIRFFDHSGIDVEIGRAHV